MAFKVEKKLPVPSFCRAHSDTVWCKSEAISLQGKRILQGLDTQSFRISHYSIFWALFQWWILTPKSVSFNMGQRKYLSAQHGNKGEHNFEHGLFHIRSDISPRCSRLFVRLLQTGSGRRATVAADLTIALKTIFSWIHHSFAPHCNTLCKILNLSTTSCRWQRSSTTGLAQAWICQPRGKSWVALQLYTK